MGNQVSKIVLYNMDTDDGMMMVQVPGCILMEFATSGGTSVPAAGFLDCSTEQAAFSVSTRSMN